MDNSDRPVFAPEVEFQIEQIQNQADLIAWEQLQALQVPTPIAQKMMRASYPPQQSGPPPRKKPNEIRMVIRSYARMLYFAEANLYQDGLELKEQLTHLAALIIERIEETITEVEELGIKSSVGLEHHGISKEGMRNAALSEISEWIRKRLAHFPPPNKPPLPPEIQAQMANPSKYDDSDAAAYLVEVPAASQTTVETNSTAEADATEKQRREKLLADYKESTGDPSNKRIYEARNAGIYKPEFYKWLQGMLPRGSETARNFERFLREKRAPIPRHPKE
jgi:hypothetical protein